MPAYTREEWNDIIKRINDLAENPDGGCDELEPLEEVEPDHIWTKKDIEDAREKLKEICDENEFNEELKLWSQKVIDEFDEAIEKGWCNCDCNCETTTTIIHEALELVTRIHRVNACGPYPGPAIMDCPDPGFFDWGSFANSVTGFQQGIGGGFNIFFRDFENGEPVDLAVFCFSSSFDCGGNIKFPFVPHDENDGKTNNPQRCFATECSPTVECCFLWFCGPCGCSGGPRCGTAGDASQKQDADAAFEAQVEKERTRRFFLTKVCPVEYSDGASEEDRQPCQKCCPDNKGYRGIDCPELDPDDEPEQPEEGEEPPV